MAGSEEVVVSMEELQEMRKVVRKEAGQASSWDSDQPVIEAEEAENLSIVVQVGATSGSITSREERFNSIRMAEQADPSQSQAPKTRIQKVPSVLKDTILRDTKDWEKLFEPVMISIGPYHYGKGKLKLGEKLKLKLTQQFFKDREHQIEVLYDKIFKEIGKLRACYDEEPTNKYDDEALAWMLFVDGCSVLRYIHCRADEKLDELKIKNHESAFVHQDLFLLENQLPFQVLKLMSDNGMEKIEKFIQGDVSTPERKRWKQRLQQEWRRKQPTPPPPQQKPQPPPPPPQQKPQPPPPPQQPENVPCHLLELLRTKLVGKPSNQDENTGKEDWQSFRDVTELRAAGIHLRRSKTNFLHDVSFTSHLIFFGYLSLPPLVVDDSTKAKFLNLIAYEMCPDFDNKFEVTSYIWFLDSLIDQADDVKKLRKKCILHNFLGSDEEVAKLFNEIATDLVPNSEIYRHVKAGIQKHYDDIGKAWMAEFVHSHFSSPWTVIAFIAAVAVFALSVVPYFQKDQK